MTDRSENNSTRVDELHGPPRISPTNVTDLIEQSSLGTAGARQLRARGTEPDSESTEVIDPRARVAISD
ncbi:hypothetical protein [Nocardia alba]|uniref:FXSXX-COOH protein n=1 Tax=Nocardia alba TaxID=225051 RepID=A0A4R1FAY3_9NOCA|nr:hypothetical protein [Nocardia alba]TCJ89972.1 hypothetical protein DFR71_6265 [Nocardia alba]